MSAVGSTVTSSLKTGVIAIAVVCAFMGTATGAAFATFGVSATLHSVGIFLGLAPQAGTLINEGRTAVGGGGTPGNGCHGGGCPTPQTGAGAQGNQTAGAGQ